MKTNDALRRLVQELVPDGRLVSSRRLRGGLCTRMDLLRLEDKSGERSSVVLRRYVRRANSSSPITPAAAQYEFAVLQLLQRAAVPAPVPLLLDAEGDYFTLPSMVLSYVPGQSWITPRKPRAYAAQLARAALAIHAVTPTGYELGFLRPKDRAQLRARLTQLALNNSHALAEPLARKVFSVVDRLLETVELLPPCLVHDDYFPGNTVWYRGSLAAVIDWSSVVLSEPRLDLAQCRLDLVVTHDTELADDFLSYYADGCELGRPEMGFFDLYRGLWALVYYKLWLKGYHDAGLTHLKPKDVNYRLRQFVQRALDEVQG